MLPLATSAISYFQAIVLGILQGATELFPISSLGHTVLFPTLFGWNGLVDAQSQSESYWLALVVMLHVGSALGLLFYYRRDWVQIVRAFFHTLSTRRAETPTERLAWLIVIASIPAGILGIVFEHELRTLTAKPEVAAIFLMVNGCVLFAAEWFRRRAQVRELVAREGAKADGGRELDTLEYREALVVGVAQSTALIAGISREGVTMGAGLARGLDHSTRRASRSCWRRRSSSPRDCSSSPTCSGTTATACAARRSWRASRRRSRRCSRSRSWSNTSRPAR